MRKRLIGTGYFPHFFCVCQLVCVSVCPADCRKMAEWILIPFGIVGPRMCSLVGGTECNFGGGYLTDRKFVTLLCENAWSNWAAVWGGEWGRAKEWYVRWESRLPIGKGQFWGICCPLVTMGFSNALLVEKCIQFIWEKLIRFPFTQCINGFVFQNLFWKCS